MTPDRDYKFADMGTSPSSVGECACGRGRKVAQFRVDVRDYKSGSKARGKGRGSLSRTVCESCAVELFLTTKAAIEDRT